MVYIGIPMNNTIYVTAAPVIITLVAVMSIAPVMGYTIDSTINNNLNNLDNTKISPTGADKPLANATIIDSSSGSSPTLYLGGSYVSLIGTVTYKSNQTETKLLPIDITPNIQTIDKLPNDSTMYHLTGPNGYLKLTMGPTGNQTGILHLEGIQLTS